MKINQLSHPLSEKGMFDNFWSWKTSWKRIPGMFHVAGMILCLSVIFLKTGWLTVAGVACYIPYSLQSFWRLRQSKKQMWASYIDARAAIVVLEIEGKRKNDKAMEIEAQLMRENLRMP